MKPLLTICLAANLLVILSACEHEEMEHHPVTTTTQETTTTHTVQPVGATTETTRTVY